MSGKTDISCERVSFRWQMTVFRDKFWPDKAGTGGVLLRSSLGIYRTVVGDLHVRTSLRIQCTKHACCVSHGYVPTNRQWRVAARSLSALGPPCGHCDTAILGQPLLSCAWWELPSKLPGNFPLSPQWGESMVPRVSCTGEAFTLYMYEHYQVMSHPRHHLAALVSDRQVVSVVDDRWSVVAAQTWTWPSDIDHSCSMSIGHTFPTRKEVVLPSSL